MLTMTNDALAVVRKFTANPRLHESSGVRIAERAATTNLQVRAVNEPKPGDLVVEKSGGRIYVGPAAVRRLRGRVLDVRRDTSGRIEFVLKAA
jgi:Fe-S cluster assembly iron-binding protein IscA